MSADDEFKINEPNIGKTSAEKEKAKLKRARAVEFALKCSLIMSKKNLDADNIFQVSKGDMCFCTLAEVIPCKEPHCRNCNFVLLYEDMADKMLRFIGEGVTARAVNTVRESMKENEERWVNEMMEKVKRDVEGDDDDE